MAFIRIAAFLVLLGTSAPASSNELTIQELTPALAAFRQAAIADPQAAFGQYAVRSAATQINELGGTLCPHSDPTLGWQFFFGTAVGAMTSLNEKTALTMLYCPWADVALLCEWSSVDGTPKISDAELIVGDNLRKAKQPDALPLWRRDGTVPPPLANVVATSDTVKAFLDIYGKKSLFKAADWRSKLPNMKTKNQIDINRSTAGNWFTQMLASISLFFNEPTFAPLKSSMDAVRQMLLDGRTADVLAMAAETSMESRAILTEVPLDWRKATMTSLVADPKNAFVFMADFDNPEYFACFWFAMSEDAQQATLKRIDFLGHTLSREQVDAIARQAEIKR